MKNSDHIIRRIRVHVSAQGQSNPFQLRNRMEQLCSKLIPQKLEKILSGFESDETIELPSIELNLEGEDWNQIESEILDRCYTEVETRLRSQVISAGKNAGHEASKDISSTKEIKHYSPADVFFHFLQHGTLPWWTNYSSVESLEDDLMKWLEGISQEELRRRLLLSFQKLPQLSSALTRLTNQFSEGLPIRLIQIIEERNLIILELFRQLLSEAVTKKDQDRVALKKIESIFIAELLSQAVREDHSVLTRLQRLPDKADEIKFLLDRLLNQSSSEIISSELRSFLSKPEEEITSKIPEAKISGKKSVADKKKETFPEEGDYFFVQNAGVIILHPFLERFFGHLELLDEEGNFFESEIHKAIHLTYYLCTGEMNPPEFKMMLNKILYGMPIEFPMENQVITEEEKTACDELLLAVVEHWTALKSTSPSSMQNTFLQREGKLEFRDDTWWLKVEQKTEDILLDRLPWSISRIKLRWMEHWLRVEWNA